MKPSDRSQIEVTVRNRVPECGRSSMRISTQRCEIKRPLVCLLCVCVCAYEYEHEYVYEYVCVIWAPVHYVYGKNRQERSSRPFSPLGQRLPTREGFTFFWARADLPPDAVKTLLKVFGESLLWTHELRASDSLGPSRASNSGCQDVGLLLGAGMCRVWGRGMLLVGFV